jgi:hypothetical protein
VNEKKVIPKKEQVNHWVEQFLQAKASGDKARMKMFEAIIIKLGGKVPRI